MSSVVLNLLVGGGGLALLALTCFAFFHMGKLKERSQRAEEDISDAQSLAERRAQPLPTNTERQAAAAAQLARRKLRDSNASPG